MMKKNVWKKILPAIMLAAAPFAANAEIFTLPAATGVGDIGTNSHFTGLLLTTTTKVGSWDGSTFAAPSAGTTLGVGSTYTLTNPAPINLLNIAAGASGTDLWTSAISTNDDQGKFNFGDINLSATSALGSDFVGAFVGSFSSGFTGNINFGNVTLSNASSATNWTTAINFNGAASGKSNVGSSVGIGNITVNANGAAAGFSAKDLVASADVVLGDINVTSATSNAIGVTLNDVVSGAKIKTGNITVIGGDDGNFPSTDANGVSISGIDSGASVEFGAISATATGTFASASGVFIGGSASTGTIGLTITNNITASVANANNTNGGAHGILIDDDGKENKVTVTIDTTSNANLSITASNAYDASMADSINARLSHTDSSAALVISGTNAFTNDGKDFIVRDVAEISFATDADLAENSAFENERTDLAIDVAANKTVKIGEVNVYGNKFGADTSDAGSTLEIGYLTGSDVGFTGTGNTVKNGDVGSLTINDDSSLNTSGDFTADKITGGTDSLLNVQSGTTRTSDIKSDGTVNVAGRLVIDNGYVNTGAGSENSIADLTGNGYILFEKIESGQDLLKVTGSNDFTGSAVAVDTLGVGVKYDGTAQKYSSIADGIAYIADGYLAIASIHSFNTGLQATQDHLISGRARRLGFLGQSECDPCEPAGCNPCDPCGALVGSGTRSAWVNYVGRNNQYQSSYNGRDFWNTTSNGVQVGVDLYRTYKNQIGVLFGYEKSDSGMRANSIDADDVYVGFYAAHVFSGGADARIIANFGWQNYDSVRSNYAATQFYAASFDGRTTELNLELGKRFYRSSSLSFRPVAAIDLYINDVDGSTETEYTAYGDDSAVKYNGLSYTQAFLRLGSDFKVERKRATLNGGVYYAYDLNNNKLKSTVEGLGAKAGNTYNLYGSDLGRQVVTFNVGGSFKVNSKFDVFGGFTGNAYVDRDGTPFQSVGYVGGAVRW